MPTVRKRFIAPLRDAGKGISRRPSTVAAITVCNQQLSTPAQVINPERCPIQTDFEFAEYYCKCEPGAVYNVIGQRKGVVIGGTSGLWFETPGQVVIVGGTVFFLYVDSVGGVTCGGSARRGPDITNLRATGGAVVNGFAEISTARQGGFSYEVLTSGGVMCGGSARRGPDITNISARGGVVINGFADVFVARPGGFRYEIDARGGVMCGGSARRGPDITNISTSGGAVVSGWTEVSMHTFSGDVPSTLTIIDSQCALAQAAGVLAGGTADVETSAFTLQFECIEGTVFRQVGDYTPCGIVSNYSCGGDSYQGLELNTTFDWSEIFTDGTVGGSLFDGTKAIENATLTINGDVYVASGSYPYNPINAQTLFFQLTDPTVWRLYGTQNIQIDVTVDGEVYTWFGSQTFDSCPIPQLDNNNPGTPYFSVAIQNSSYDSINDETTVSVLISYPCYGDSGMNVTALCWFAPDIGGCFCTDNTLPQTVGSGNSEEFQFTFPGDQLGAFLGSNMLCINFDQPLNCTWNWFFFTNIPTPP